MNQDTTVTNNQVIVKLSGSIYVVEAASIRQNLLKYIDKGHKQFRINLSNVDYIDSSGVGVLVAVQKKAVQNGGGVAVEGLKGIVKELFELTRLTKIFEVRS